MSLSESPIEDEIERLLPKYIADDASISQQIPIEYRTSQFRIDFLITCGALRIAIECDGRQYHSAARDLFRDAYILGTTEIASIYRISGTDIWRWPETALHLISEDIPDIFSQRGRTNLQTLSDARFAGEIYKTYDYLSWTDDNTRRSLTISKLTKLDADPFWKELYDFSMQHPSLSVEQLADLYFK
jgi:hypothetical protein